MSLYKELTDDEEYKKNHAQWRAAANENMDYTYDFPAALLTLPEAFDGSISHGSASRIKITIILPTADSPAGTLGILIIEDNGGGIVNDEALERLLSWASANSMTVHHRYGHGTKKFLTKWLTDYEAAIWMLQFRTKSRRGGSHTNDLVEIKSPFLGLKTPRNITDDDTNLNPSGLRWTIKFDPKVLGDFTSPVRLFNAIKEIIRTRYSRIPLAATTFELEVFEGTRLVKKEDSSNWKTLEEVILDEVKASRARVSRGPTTGQFEGGRWDACEYLILDDKILRSEFPTYGHRSMQSSRVHMGLDGRYIEARQIHKMLGILTNHNDFNGRIAIVNFIPNEATNYDKLPTPATTKVAFSETCPIFLEFKTEFAKFLLTKELSIVDTQELKIGDIDRMLVDDLKKWCEKKGISTKKLKKAEIIEALKETFLTPEERAAAKEKKEHLAKEELEKRQLQAQKDAEARAKKEKEAAEKAKKLKEEADKKKKEDADKAKKLAEEQEKKRKEAEELAAKKEAEEKEKREKEAAEAAKRAAEEAARLAEEAKGVGISLDGTNVVKYKKFPKGKTMDDFLKLINNFFESK